MKKALLATAIMVLFGFGLVVQTNALTVSTQDCSVIDPSDGDTSDWADIEYLVEPNENPEDGTNYYYDTDNSEWTTDSTVDWRYRTNLEQWAYITSMKVCNTADDFFLNLENDMPMFSYYDKQLKMYFDFWMPISSDFSEFLTMPADFKYWMVWKMQDVNAEGNIIYFAANLLMEVDSNEQEEDHPKLYFYEESDATTTYEEATFNPNEDTKLTRVQTTNDEADMGDDMCGPKDQECEITLADYGFKSKKDMAFEVRQDITEFFNYADFGYGDQVNLTVAMYDSDDFSVTSSTPITVLATDESDSGKYRFSKKGVRNLRKVKGSKKKTSMRLQWKKFKNKRNYQVKVYKASNDKLVKTLKSIKKNKKTITGLKTSTEYRAIVRAKKKNGKYSAWSSGYKWETK